MLCRLIQRELRIACRRGAEVMNPLWFFLIVITLFPLGIGPDPHQLARIAPGIVWVAALLSCCSRWKGCFVMTLTTARWSNFYCRLYRCRSRCWGKSSPTGWSRACR